MASTATPDIKNQLYNIIKCSICCETFKEPRQLPCIHTFCLNCIRGFTRNKHPGDGISCPLCRKEFTIPKSGVVGLPNNFFVEQLRDMLGPPSIHCEVCSGAAMEKVATMYCVDCNERQCEACAGNHSRMKISRDHQVIRMNKKESEEITKIVKLFCQSHKDKPLELYCYDCKAAICMMCFVKTHKSHKCSDVHEVADEFRKQMTNDIRRLVGTMTRCRSMVGEEKKKEIEFCSKLDSIEIEVCDRVEKLKQAIDKEKAKLLNELRSRKVDRSKQVHQVIREIEHHESFVESLVEYTEQLRDKGTASSVVQQTSSLHDRADELATLGALQKAVKELGSINIKFTAEAPLVQTHGRLIGLLHQEIGAEYNTPSLKHAISAHGQVNGVTFINNELFVLRHPSEEKVQVYETATFTQQRTVRVAGLRDYVYEDNDGDYFDGYWWHKALTSCNVINCLFVCDRDKVFNVDLTIGNVINWQVNGKISGLSVNAANHVIVISNLIHEIREYSANGRLVRTIDLQASDIPLHAAQLTNGRFVVSQYTSSFVSLLDERGREIARYGGDRGTTEHLFNVPKHLTVTQNGTILVADSYNHRLVALDSTLRSARLITLPLAYDDRMSIPYCTYYDESIGRLYVGEASGKQRLLIFDNINISFE